MATLAGAVFGVLVYLVNFYVMGRYFNWFDEARGWESLFAHIMFGVDRGGCLRQTWNGVSRMRRG